MTILRRREAGALLALAFLVSVSAAWWALALWPLPAAAPAWVPRTRLVCFGASSDGLPSVAGWMLLLLEPPGMLAALLVIWGSELRDGLRLVARHALGRATLIGASVLVVLGLAAAARRVQAARSAGTIEDRATQHWVALQRPAPELDLTDQHGDRFSLQRYAGRSVLVTFAYGHCETVCPLLVSDLLRARQLAGADAPGLVIVTLDPWRDTPERLAQIIGQWRADSGTHLLSGPPEEVGRVLDAWAVPRTRDLANGEVTHPNAVYIVGPDGRIAYMVPGGQAETAVALAVEAGSGAGLGGERQAVRKKVSGKR